jgi:hypothetical protein
MKRASLTALTLVALLAGCGSASTTTITRTAAPPSTSAASSTIAPPTTVPPVVTTTAAPPPSTSTAAPTPSSTVYFEGVAGGRAQRPRTLQLTGDGTLEVTGAQWSSWGGSTATGSGNAEYHGCTPNCAQATVHMAFVSVRMSGVRTCSGRQYYSSVTLTLNSGKLLDESFMQRSWSPC